MHAFLFAGGTRDQRLQEIQRKLSDWRILAVDCVTLSAETEHITIGQVREFQKRLLFSPMQSPFTAGIIRDATALTIEAQQALLKLLEEPPPHAYILCESETEHQLLPTIVSRCQVIRMGETTVDHSAARQTIEKLLNGKPSEIFLEVDNHTGDRGAAKQWMQELLFASRELMLVQQSETIVALIRRLQKAQAQLSVNCNPKLVLDRVFLQ